jgi:hypothetical protein
VKSEALHYLTVLQAAGRQEALQEALNLPSATGLSERLRQLREAGGGATAEGIAQGLEAELAGIAPLGLEAELQLQRALMLEWPLYTAQLAAQVGVVPYTLFAANLTMLPTSPNGHLNRLSSLNLDFGVPSGNPASLCYESTQRPR